MSFVRGASIAGMALGLMGLAACGGGGGSPDARVYSSQSEGGFRLGLPRIGGGQPVAQASIGVNSFLWRATLDTLSFIPLQSADPYGGVILTEWYNNPEKPDERFKVTVYILDTRLRADGLNVTVFKQTRDAAGGWVDAAAAAQTETDIENAILTRARQLRLSTVGG